MSKLTDLRGIGGGKMAYFREKTSVGIVEGEMANTRGRDNTKMAVFDRI